MIFEYTVPLALAAALLDVCVGYPERLRRAIGHPVSWLAAFEAGFAARLARFDLEPGMGLLAYLAPVGAAAGLIAYLFSGGPLGFALMALLTSTLVARQPLDRGLRRVAEDFERSDAKLPDFQAAGPLKGLATAYALRVAAPLFWIALAGFPGGALYLALYVAGRRAREAAPPREGDWSFAARWVERPGEWLASVWLAGAAALTWRTPHSALMAPLREGAPGDVLSAALTPGGLDLRRGLALFRRASAIEIVVLAVLAVAIQS